MCACGVYCIYACVCVCMFVREKELLVIWFSKRGVLAQTGREKGCLVSLHLASWTGDFITQFVNSVLVQDELY